MGRAGEGCSRRGRASGLVETERSLWRAGCWSGGRQRGTKGTFCILGLADL